MMNLSMVLLDFTPGITKHHDENSPQTGSNVEHLPFTGGFLSSASSGLPTFGLRSFSAKHSVKKSLSPTAIVL